MGQQQLLLLVLSTVIVGLATVAGIQAFSENQQQATQDALVQRAINIGNDVLAAHNEPSQFGGINLNESDDDASDVAQAAGYGSGSDAATGIPADGAGDNAACAINNVGSGTAEIICNNDPGNDDGTTTADGDSDFQSVTVTVDAGTDEVSANTINGSSV
jgi:hypothetical protein